MSSQPASRRNSSTHYRRNTLIIAAITAVSTALLVIPAWRNSGGLPPSNQWTTPTPTPTPRPSPVQTPQVVSTPLPAVKPNVCGRWKSVSSQKIYDFVCQGQRFEIRELNGEGQNNTGSGSVSQDGEIQAALLIAKKDRTAHLRLRLSNDGQRLDGSWYGNDPRESGTLSFYRIQ